MEERGSINEEEKREYEEAKLYLKHTGIDDFKWATEKILKLVDKQQKEIEELKKCYVIKPKELEKEINKEWQDKIKEIMRKDRDCLTFGYHSAYVGLLDDLIKLIEEE